MAADPALPPAQSGRAPWFARVAFLIGLVLHVVLQLGPAYEKTANTPSARDYASYYYAVKVAAQGGDPYDTPSLGRISRAEHTRNTVQPFFYPPPFLLTQVWALGLPLHTASYLTLLCNELLLWASLWALRRWYGVGLVAIGLVLATYTPIPDNAWMGQANLLALLPALVGLGVAPRRPVLGGVLVGTAAMLKMSPALFLLYWLLRKNWRAVGAAIATAVGLSVLALPLVGLGTQLRFYTEVLPGFLSGDYHQLTVAISLPANHSVPDIFARMWPGATPTSMSDRALAWSRAANLGLLTLWVGAVWRGGAAPAAPTDVVGDRFALGALTILMTILPVYTYEHHLVFLLLPVTALTTWAVTRGERSSPVHAAIISAFAVGYFFLAWPLTWLNEARSRYPAWEDLPRESKFIMMLGIFVLALGLVATRRSTRPDGRTPGRSPA